jgi:hypothetical protein
MQNVGDLGEANSPTFLGFCARLLETLIINH